MKNLEKYKDKKLHEAAKDYLHEKGLDLDRLHPWTKHDWFCFADWLFKETTFKFRIEYQVSNVPYLQEFILDATDPTDAKEKFLEFMGQNMFLVRIVRISSGGE